MPAPGLALLLAACTPAVDGGRSAAAVNEDLGQALASVYAGDMLRHITVLASDEFEGRGPGTRGEELTVNYLIGEFKRLGLKPGNPDGTYVQEVPFIGAKAKVALSISVGGKTIDLKEPDDFWVRSSLWQVPEVNIENSPLVFVGYGVVAPEYGWDDFKGVDVKGKTLITLPNDPQIPDPNDPGKLDEAMFKGKAVTF